MMCDSPEHAADGLDEDGSVTHAKTVLDWMESCWRSGDHLDTRLVPGYGGVVRCHRLMLTSISRLLANILEDTEDDITLIVPDITDKELELFLDYIYTGKTCINSSNVLMLLKCLQIPADTSLCHHYSSSATTVINPDVKLISEHSHLKAMEDHSDKKDLDLISCPICLTQFESKSDLSSHMVVHLGEFKCDQCHQIHPSSKELLAHKESVHSSESQTSLKEAVSSENRKFKCPKCEESFRLRSDLKKHCESVHNEKVSDLVPCTICSKLIVTRRLNEHIKMVHCNEKPLSCEQCDKKFAKPSELKNHIRTHTGERPFICDICNASFAYSHILTRHKKYHEGAKKFSCNSCGKSFLQKNDLIKHSRIHSGEKPYNCDLCGKGFARMDYLKKHQMLHSIDTKFCCSECGELCGSMDGLKKHKVHHHRPNLELNSFEDLALPLPGLDMEGMQDSIQAVSLDGGKTIMIVNDVTDMEHLDGQDNTSLSSDNTELILAHTEISDTEATPILYAVQY